MSRHIYLHVVSKKIYLYVNIHAGLHALATLGEIENMDCVSWDRTTSGGTVTIDQVVLACNKPLLMKALCINLPVHGNMMASALVRRNINASCSSICKTRGFRDHTRDIRICFRRDRLGMLSKNWFHRLWFGRSDEICYWQGFYLRVTSTFYFKGMRSGSEFKNYPLFRVYDHTKKWFYFKFRF